MTYFSPPAGRAARLRRHGATTTDRPVLAAFVTVAAAVAGFALVFSMTVVDGIERSFTVRDITGLLGEDVVADPVDPAAGQPINILVLGTDERNDENADLGGGGGGRVEGMRSDATLIMHISADRERVELLSIPRDMRATIPECQHFDGSVTPARTGKFNVAFSNGGRYGDRSEAAACSMRTVTQMTGISFQHYAVIDFAGFRDMIDALDGVPMCVPERLYSPQANLDLQAGPQVLDGTTALAWARARTGTGLGDGTDLGRIERQQELLNNTFRKALGMNMLTDAGSMSKFAKAVAESLTMDPAFGDVSFLVGLGYSLKDIDTSSIVFDTVPWQYAPDGSGDVVMTAEAMPLFSRIVADLPLTEPEVTPSPQPGAPAPTTDPSGDDAAGGEPNASPQPKAPKRETQEEILSACT